MDLHGGVGIGWRQPHYARVMDERPAIDFLEVHAENFFAPGGAARAALRAVRAHYPVSLHGVGLSLGSACGIDEGHLAALAALVADIDPVFVSDHASFARVDAGDGLGVRHAADLLPIAFTRASLDILCSNVQQVQDVLRRPLLVENLSSYLRWTDQDLDEPAFMMALVRRTGCRLLLDVNNLVVNACNDQASDPVAAACAWVDGLSRGAVAEIHLAGHTRTPDLVIDDHGSRVDATVWAVYRHALDRLSACPTLVEWDTALPTLDVLLEEAWTAREFMATKEPA